MTTPKFNKRQEKALQAIRDGAPDATAFASVGASQDEWDRWLGDPAFADARRKVRAELEVEMNKIVRDAAKNDPRLAQKIADRLASEAELERLRGIAALQ